MGALLCSRGCLFVECPRALVLRLQPQDELEVGLRRGEVPAHAHLGGADDRSGRLWTLWRYSRLIFTGVFPTRCATVK